MREATKEEVLNVLFDPRILPLISDKQVDRKDFKLPAECGYYTLSGNEIFIVHPDGQVHANILPEVTCKADKARSFVRFCFDELGHKRLWAEIPKKYLKIYCLALRAGFSVYKETDKVNYLEVKFNGIR